MARTRETTAGPNDTAPIPIIRQAPSGPAAPRPGVRQPEGQRPTGQRSTGQPPVRSRLRTPPPGMPPTAHGLPPLPRSLREPAWPATRPLPTQPPAPPRVSLPPAAPAERPAPRPAAPAPARALGPTSTAPAAPVPALRPTAPVPALRPTARPVTQAFSTLAPPPLPPEPADFAEPLTPARRRRGPKGVLAVLAVLALTSVWVLPAFAGHALGGASLRSTDDEVQHLRVGDAVEGGAVSTDALTGSAAVEAAGGASSDGWMRPVARAKLGDPFGPRPVQPVAGVSLFHRGQDIIAPCGTPIRAAAAGTVTTATWWGTYGNWILVDTGNGVAVGYAHESRIAVSVGQRVEEGQVIGYVGETGAATGCHLHLEVHLHGVAVNPVPFFIAKQIPLAG